MADPPPPAATFAEKLDHLFRQVKSPNGDEFTYDEVVTGIRDRGGPEGSSISTSYLWQLRRGTRTNPTLRHMESIAGFFGVSPAYFLDDEAFRRIEEQLQTIAMLRDQSVHQVAARAAGLSPNSLQAIAEMIESARRIEGLKDGQDPPAS